MKYSKEECEAFLKHKSIRGKFYEFRNDEFPFQYDTELSYDPPRVPKEIIFYMEYNEDTLVDIKEKELVGISPSKDKIVICLDYKEFSEFVKNEKKCQIREKLAEFAHSQWSGWMEYLFSKGVFNEDGTWTMPEWAVKRWTTQIKTNYKDLSESEKDSDRSESDSDRSESDGMLKIIYNKQKN